MPRKKKLEARIYPDIMNMAETRSYLRLSYGTVLQLITSGQIPARKVGKEWRVCREDAIAWVRNGSPKRAAEDTAPLG